MNIIEKRDFIQSYLHLADKNLIEEIYERLLKNEKLKAKLGSRALKSEEDINSGHVYSRSEIEQRTSDIGSK